LGSLAAALLLAVGVFGLGVFGLGSAGRGLRSQSVRVAGVPVEVVHGPGTGTGAAQRPAVVVAHGYAGSGRLMRPFADTLARRGYVVALPDLAGHAANTRPLTGVDAADRDVAAVVQYLRGRPDVDPGRVALLGHSMGAAAVVRAGAADPRIAATVAISLGDGGAAALRPGPRRLLLLAGALEPAGLTEVARAASAGSDDGRVVRVPFVEHVGVLYADRTHREAAHWLDDALGNRPVRPVVEAKRRVGAGGLILVGLLSLVFAALLRPSSRRPSRTAGERLGLLAGAVVVAPVPAFAGGLVLARLLPAAVCGYLIGYFVFAGATLGAAALVARRRRPRSAVHPQWTEASSTVVLALAGSAAVIVPVHLGLTAAVPHGAHWWLVVLLALATAALLGGAYAVARSPWAVAVLAAVCLPLPVAALAGLAPGFIVVITPLIAVLFVVHLVTAGAAWLRGAPVWCTIPAGALLVAWPVATALPLT
jgi:dienelactone hydrolase